MTGLCLPPAQNIMVKQTSHNCDVILHGVSFVFVRIKPISSQVLSHEDKAVVQNPEHSAIVSGM
jgi:hypothetical protein